MNGAPRAQAERPDPVTRVLRTAPWLAVTAVLFSLLRLAEHLVFGGDTSARHAVIGALAFFLIALVMVPICDGVARWWHESGDRPAS